MPANAAGWMRVARLEPRARGGRVGEPAAHEHLAHDEADPERALQREDVGDGTRRDVEPGGHARRTLGAAPDGTRKCDGCAGDGAPRPLPATGGARELRPRQALAPQPSR
jgi:hypothetical protein